MHIKESKNMTRVQLVPLEASDREQFIRDNQEAFNYGVMEEFGLRNAHFEDQDDEQIIPAKPLKPVLTRVKHTVSLLTERLSEAQL